eukprot:5706289-Prymnesium_polylepis.1
MLLAPACAMRRRHTSHRLSRRRKSPLDPRTDESTSVQVPQHWLSTACRAQGRSQGSRFDRCKL